MMMTPEQASLKAREQFDALRDFVQRAAQEGQRIDSVERELFRQLLGMGHTLLSAFVTQQGDGDLGPEAETAAGRSARRLPEYYSDENRAYAARDDDSLLRMLLGKLERGGQILFYRGSNAHADTQALIDEMVRRRELAKLADYKTLTAYRGCELAA